MLQPDRLENCVSLEAGKKCFLIQQSYFPHCLGQRKITFCRSFVQVASEHITTFLLEPRSSGLDLGALLQDEEQDALLDCSGQSAAAVMSVTRKS
ncbi:hypothetical protein T10_151 [Trichinella papuae]|uniref:Uncharacterized protein n=1 Tax=Trichinella papuae TaxID=268474 RepID=A0A0V1MZ92_9BILA|nr:hypothetical protein T10_151 [Trichinella papuae]